MVDISDISYCDSVFLCIVMTLHSSLSALQYVVQLRGDRLIIAKCFE